MVVRALLLLAAAITLFPGPSSMPEPRIADHAHAFDFWLGDWKLTWGDSGAATNRIVREMDDRVIAEHFHDPQANYRGSSWSVYDSLSDRWHQTWVDTQGNYFALSGAWKEDRMVLETSPTDHDGLRFYRMVFRDIERDGFWWEWSVTEDKGASWTLKWRIRYARM